MAATWFITLSFTSLTVRSTPVRWTLCASIVVVLCILHRFCKHSRNRRDGDTENGGCTSRCLQKRWLTPKSKSKFLRNGNRHICLIMGIKKAHAIMLSNNRCSVGMDYHHFCKRCKDTHIFEICKEKGEKVYVFSVKVSREGDTGSRVYIIYKSPGTVQCRGRYGYLSSSFFSSGFLFSTKIVAMDATMAIIHPASQSWPFTPR